METDLTNQIYEIKKNLEDIKIIPRIFTKIILDIWLEIDKECAKILRIITLKELKYVNVPNEDAIDIFCNINTKMDIIKSYVDHWAAEIGKRYHDTKKVTGIAMNQKYCRAVDAH